MTSAPKRSPVSRTALRQWVVAEICFLLQGRLRQERQPHELQVRPALVGEEACAADQSLSAN